MQQIEALALNLMLVQFTRSKALDAPKLSAPPLNLSHFTLKSGYAFIIL